MSNIILYKGSSSIVRTSGSELTSTIKGQVQKAGGRTKAALRISLSWHNTDDYDLHVREPDYFHICYEDTYHEKTMGELDVDMNCDPIDLRVPAVENITWPKKEKMLEGEYRVKVHNYYSRNRREKNNYGCVVEIEYEGKLYIFERPEFIDVGESILITRFMFSKKHGITFIHGFLPKYTSRASWQIDRGTWEQQKTLLK